MKDVVDTDLCITGAGPGDISVAAGAAQTGASVVLVEKGKMGGDCLNYRITDRSLSTPMR